MILLSARNIEKAFGINTILNGVSLTVNESDRLGLVGQNGSGKTTFFRILAGLDAPDAGQVSLSGDVRIGYLAQQSDIAYDSTVWDYMEDSFAVVFRMENRLRELEERMADADDVAFRAIAAEYDRLTRRFEEAGGYSWRSTIQGVLAGLMFTQAQYTQPVASLSGGEKTRLSLARLLTSGAELLMLDEPTNHLDLESTAWLENYLKGYRGTVLVISHDRYFLDALCTGIAELAFGRITQYPGSYSRYLTLRQEAWERQSKLYTLQQKEISRQEAIIARYRQFNREKSIRAAESREKALERLERVERPQEEASIRFRFEAAGNTGNDILLADGITKAFGDRTLFSGVDLHLRAGDRVALIGPNGAGKSTLLKILLGKVPADAGNLLWGTGVKKGYYDQQQTELNPGNTIIEEIREAYPAMTDTQIRNVLGTFLFVGDDAFQRIETLSGGERARVALTKLMLRKDNVLILDEPTNHLDMDSREVLEAALMGYTGTLLAVSHDRFFINRIANRVWVMTGEGIVDYPGNYDEYVEKKRQMELLAVEDGDGAGLTRTAQKQEKRKEKEMIARQREVEERVAAAEAEIAEAEREKGALEARLADPGTYADPAEAARLAIRYRALEEEIPELYAKWEEAAMALEGEG